MELNKSNRKLLIALVAALIVVATGIILALVAINAENNAASSEEEDEYAGIEYDYSNEDTGGKETELQPNQTLDFLGKYGITDDDMAYIESKIFIVLDDYYFATGYNDIYYDINNVQVSSDWRELIFTLKTDLADRIITVTLTLNNGIVETVSII